MASIKPFPALLPNPAQADRICELPYDVMSSEEARGMAAGNPLSFLHVSKPEIDLPPFTDPHDASVYARGAENFRRMIAEGHLRQHPRPGFFLYRQIMGSHRQLGLVAVASCAEYQQGIVKKHELTRPDKEDDRVRHMEALQAQTGPVFLTYPADDELDARLAARTKDEPMVDFTAKDAVRHTSWLMDDPKDVAWIEERFTHLPSLYIADGHHRSAAAARVADKMGHLGAAAWFLTVLFPHNQLQVLPYNRALKDLNGRSPAQLLAELDAVFVVKQAASPTPTPTRPHELALYLEGRWHQLGFRPKFAATEDPLEKLDVTLLQRHVLDPIFGIDNPRTSDRIAFIGGIRGTGELEKRVQSGEFACAFSMYPTRVEDLMAISDRGGLMPPKSTWFEPKLRDAMFCHMLG